MSLKPGVYLFLNKKGKVLYVGKAKNLKKRVSSYFANKTNLLEKTKILVSQISTIETIEVASEIEALLLEADYIKHYKPKYNARLTDGKRYPFLRITVKDQYPKVLIARNTNDKKSIYFGPFPNSGALRLVLKTIRRIFPFQSVVNHPKKICLYNHLGLCPCPGISLDKAKEYRKSINHIIDFLKGHTQRVLRSLEKERNTLSIQEKFEKAQALQKKIDAILYVTSPDFEKFDYKINPNLETDLRIKELLELKSCLLEHNVKINNLKRIECFDISNIGGTNATGSMVVFINGESNPSLYRRFKIRTVYGSNDFAMMEEVLQRRMKHTEWPLPDLIVADGGKGQVSSTMNALKEQKVKIPIIGLAKREETIITSYFDEIKLSRDSEALKLIMRIRDEAHRFAVSYHRKLRSKAFI